MVDDLAAVISNKQQTSIGLDKKVEKKEKQFDSLSKKLAIKQAESATFAEIDAMAKSSMFAVKTASSSSLIS